MGVGDLVKAGADKAKDAAGSAASNIKDNIDEIGKDPVGHAVKKGKKAAIDAAGNTETGQKVKENIEDAKDTAKIAVDAASQNWGKVAVDVGQKIITDPGYFLRITKKIIIGSVVGNACTCGCLLAPIVVIFGIVFTFMLLIISGWSYTCPKMDIDDGAMARFITYYDAYVDAASGWTDSSGNPHDIGALYEIVDEAGNKTGEVEKYNKTTPEILAAVDYKLTGGISDDIPEALKKCTDINGDVDQVCLHIETTAAIKCRAGLIRIALQDANKNKMSEGDIDPYRNIIYLGNFQYEQVYKYRPLEKYEPFDDMFILENYDQDFGRLWKSILTPNLVDAFFNGIKAAGGILFQNLKNVWSSFWGTSKVGAATFFRLTRPELIPVRSGTPGWGTYNSTSKVATGHLKEFLDYAQKNILAAPTNPPTVPPDLYEYVPGSFPDIESPPLSNKLVACPLLKTQSFSGTATTP